MALLHQKDSKIHSSSKILTLSCKQRKLPRAKHKNSIENKLKPNLQNLTKTVRSVHYDPSLTYLSSKYAFTALIKEQKLVSREQKYGCVYSKKNENKSIPLIRNKRLPRHQ